MLAKQLRQQAHRLLPYFDRQLFPGRTLNGGLEKLELHYPQ
jgi:hypothetical protein